MSTVPVVSVADFVSARLSELGRVTSPQEARTAGPTTLMDELSTARTVLAEHRQPVHLAERWAALETQVRAIACR